MNIKEVEQNIQDWLGQGYTRKTCLSYRMGFYVFLQFLNDTDGEEWTLEKVVEKRLEDVKSRKFWFERKVVEFFAWLETYTSDAMEIPIVKHGKKTVYHKKASGVSDAQRLCHLTAVRSFFAYHRLDLRFTRQQKRLINKRPKPVFKDFLFDVKDFRKMDEVAKPKERYIMLVGKDVGLRAIDFIGLKQGLFASALDGEPPVFLGKVWTQKERVPAYPFLSEDGLEASKSWLQVLESEGLRDDGERMLSIRKKELTSNLRRLAKRAGIKTHGKRIRFHCLRKFLTDRLSLVTSESKWKQIVGKAVGERAYVSHLELREVYGEVLERIQITSKKKLGLSDQEIERLKKLADLVETGRLKISRS